MSAAGQQPAADERRALLARVHIARKEMGLDEDAYRSVVRRVSGGDSAGDCSASALRRLLDEFRHLGWTPKSRRPSGNSQVRMIHAIWKDVRALLDGTPGEAELRAFVQRQTKDATHPNGVAAPEFCNAAQATLVIEGLKGWRARLRAKRKECADARRTH